jgi:hypothetical protein
LRHAFHRLVAAAFIFSATLFFVPGASTAQIIAAPQVQVRPQPRIVSRIDNAKLVSMPQTHPARIAGLADLGPVTASTSFQNMMLVLKSSDEQEQAIAALLDQQQDKAHPNFHHWMTPASFGAAFGVASSDLAQVKAWLEDSGFTVTGVAKGGRVVQFSGTSGQVETAFHTQMHQYLVNGETRISNATDISIPAGLSPVVAGLSSLNNFRPTHSLHALKVSVDANGQITSAVPFTPSTDTSVNGSASFPSGHFVGGADFAKLYNTSPLLASGINGTGITIGVIGQTDVLLGDVQIYRSLFGLPVNNFHRVQIGGDPGTIADDGESDLDLEVSGAMAPNATINFYTSGASYFGGGIDSAMEYVIENNDADIISLSYGECEQNLGAGGNAFYSILYEQAAAQGQSIFVATGDSGPDVCDAGNYYAKTGYSVNGLGSTPYNVAVGGTQFNEGSSYSSPGNTSFWSGSNNGSVPYASALGYIPEEPWNESSFGTGTMGGLLAGSGGISLYYPMPNYQSGPGVPAIDPNPPSGSSIATLPPTSFIAPGPHRYMPDVALNASVYHDGTIFCSEGSCTLTPTGGLSSFGIVGGTSVAAPVMAGAQALIDQANGGRQGVPNYYYYKLAASQSQTACTATAYVTAAGCAFHDSQTGNTDVPSNTQGTTEIGWNAGPQYDLSVGLGSPDVAHLASNWGSVHFNATTTAFSLTPTTSAHGTAVNVTVKVTPSSGTGTPTGSVAMIAQALNGSLGFYTLANGAVTNGLLKGLPAGTYNVYARYAGDETFAASTSAPVQVTVSAEATTVAAASYLLSNNGALTAATNFTYGSNVYFSAGVAPPSGVGVPTGAITFTLNNGVTDLTPFVTQLDPNGASVNGIYYNAGAYFDSGTGLPTYNIQSTFPMLVPGSYRVSVAYGGDSTFTASKLSTPVNFTVTKATTTLNLTVNTTTINSGGVASVTASIPAPAPSAGGLSATGVITFTDTTTNTVLGTATLVNGATTFTTNAITSSGAHTINAVYAGDSNYTAQSAPVTITVGSGTSSVSLAVIPSVAQVLTPVTLTATLPGGTIGSVSFFDGATRLGSAVINQSTYKASLTIRMLIAGPHTLTATYQGGATLAASTSPAVSLNVTPNTPTLALSNQQVSPGGTVFALQSLLTLAPANGTSAAAVPPTGSVQYLDQSSSATTSVSLGTAVLQYQSGGYATYVANLNTAALKPGYHTLSSTYAGDANYASATSNTQSVAIGITSLSITSSTSSVGTNLPFTLRAVITPLIATSNTMSGSVIFYDGAPGTGAVIGTAAVSGGVATLANATLSTAATHTITAIYSGDSNFYTSTFSAGVVVATNTPGFSLAANTSSLMLKAGSTGSMSMSVNSFGNYSGTASLSCNGLPAFTTCSFAYPGGAAAQAFTFNGTNGMQSATLSIRTVSPNGPNTQASQMLWLPAFVFAALLGFRRRRISASGRHVLALALLLCGATAITGCGSGAGAATPAGTFNIVITANGVGATPAYPNLQPATKVTLTVGY